MCAAAWTKPSPEISGTTYHETVQSSALREQGDEATIRRSSPHLVIRRVQLSAEHIAGEWIDQICRIERLGRSDFIRATVAYDDRRAKGLKDLLSAFGYS